MNNRGKTDENSPQGSLSAQALEYYRMLAHNEDLSKYFSGEYDLRAANQVPSTSKNVPEIIVEEETAASPTSSVTSGRKLEWDSGADIGYSNYALQKSTSMPSLQPSKNPIPNEIQAELAKINTHDEVLEFLRTKVGQPTAESTPFQQINNLKKSDSDPEMYIGQTPTTKGKEKKCRSLQTSVFHYQLVPSDSNENESGDCKVISSCSSSKSCETTSVKSGSQQRLNLRKLSNIHATKPICLECLDQRMENNAGTQTSFLRNSIGIQTSRWSSKQEIVYLFHPDPVQNSKSSNTNSDTQNTESNQANSQNTGSDQFSNCNSFEYLDTKSVQSANNDCTSSEMKLDIEKSLSVMHKLIRSKKYDPQMKEIFVKKLARKLLKDTSNVTSTSDSNTKTSTVSSASSKSWKDKENLTQSEKNYISSSLGSGDSKDAIVSFAKKERENQLNWINNEIEHLAKLKSLLEIKNKNKVVQKGVPVPQYKKSTAVYVITTERKESKADGDHMQIVKKKGSGKAEIDFHVHDDLGIANYKFKEIVTRITPDAEKDENTSEKPIPKSDSNNIFISDYACKNYKCAASCPCSTSVRSSSPHCVPCIPVCRPVCPPVCPPVRLPCVPNSCECADLMPPRCRREFTNPNINPFGQSSPRKKQTKKIRSSTSRSRSPSTEGTLSGTSNSYSSRPKSASPTSVKNTREKTAKSDIRKKNAERNKRGMASPSTDQGDTDNSFYESLSRYQNLNEPTAKAKASSKSAVKLDGQHNTQSTSKTNQQRKKKADAANVFSSLSAQSGEGKFPSTKGTNSSDQNNKGERGSGKKITAIAKNDEVASPSDRMSHLDASNVGEITALTTKRISDLFQEKELRNIIANSEKDEDASDGSNNKSPRRSYSNVASNEEAIVSNTKGVNELTSQKNNDSSLGSKKKIHSKKSRRICPTKPSTPCSEDCCKLKDTSELCASDCRLRMERRSKVDKPTQGLPQINEQNSQSLNSKLVENKEVKTVENQETNTLGSYHSDSESEKSSLDSARVRKNINKAKMKPSISKVGRVCCQFQNMKSSQSEVSDTGSERSNDIKRKIMCNCNCFCRNFHDQFNCINVKRTSGSLKGSSELSVKQSQTVDSGLRPSMSEKSTKTETSVDGKEIQVDNDKKETKVAAVGESKQVLDSKVGESTVDLTVHGRNELPQQLTMMPAAVVTYTPDVNGNGGVSNSAKVSRGNLEKDYKMVKDLSKLNLNSAVVISSVVTTSIAHPEGNVRRMVLEVPLNESDEYVEQTETNQRSVKRVDSITSVSSFDGSTSAGGLSGNNDADSSSSSSTSTSLQCSCCGKYLVPSQSSLAFANEPAPPASNQPVYCWPCYQQSHNQEWQEEPFYKQPDHSCKCYTMVDEEAMSKIRDTLRELHEMECAESTTAKCRCKNQQKADDKLVCQQCYKKIKTQKPKVKKPVAYMLKFDHQQAAAKEDDVNVSLHEGKKHRKPKKGEHTGKENHKSKKRERRENKENKESKNLQEYLASNRPDFVRAAEERRRCMIELSYMREKRCQKYKQLLALSNAGGNIPMQSNYDDKKKFRLFSTKEMKQLTAKKYKKLPEVQQKLLENRDRQIKRANKILADIFNKKLRESVLRGQVSLSTSISVINLM